MEADGFADAHQAGALLKFSVQVHGSIYVFERNFVGAALNGDVALNMLRAGGALLQVKHGVSGVIVETDFAVLIRNVDRAVHAVDGDRAAPGNDRQVGVARYVNIQVGAHALVARALRVGIEYHHLVAGHNRETGFGIVAVGVLLVFGVNFLAPRDLQLLVVRHVDGHRAAIVVDAHGSRTRRPFLVDLAVVVEGGAAKDLVQPLIIANLDVVFKILPVHPRHLSGDQAGSD